MHYVIRERWFPFCSNLNSDWFTLKITRDMTELRFRSKSIHLPVSLVANRRIEIYTAAFILSPGRHFGTSQTNVFAVVYPLEGPDIKQKQNHKIQTILNNMSCFA